ncbi:MAG: hypothetical protein CO186_05310 [Zetaproteobacteria bacterium CG_4_9_14_3_um_filter_49_83]|nr:MAG: hypothetical protein COW62_06520 [Zetaproteobacteria bacterium CG17_big_fil_post_rev_8_21_14_2_50_50_13]PIV31294.1 MAG: hypothetical protein COS35_02185 [Zetaproteobacteria bacterium CG02_land_8_20_14_3_00_50_9]PIY55199.1 MAG: hypothetical protein COZ00_10855 [Zetaproteobacteria bacterium CG_4_10_14_0_8_um_filter_49_80]PJA35568.1 MAG: hypothetical protein CO186_05310 [Zetaproteobacteria bacterium CG_4_9_14_3_um_filter_49_83]
MKRKSQPLFTEPLSDEAAYALADALNRLSTACESAYYAQIRRHLETVRENRKTNPENPWR